jgi:hypothetical protein
VRGDRARGAAARGRRLPPERLRRGSEEGPTRPRRAGARRSARGRDGQGAPQVRERRARGSGRRAGQALGLAEHLHSTRTPRASASR